MASPPRCDCYPVLIHTLNNITCHIIKGQGYFLWTGDHWINVSQSEITYDKYCPHNYCKKGNKTIDLLRNSSNQCNFNRAGQLCGKCSEGYSLAIGSSNCILCKTNRNLAFIIFFAAAGFLLVFFIGTLNIIQSLRAQLIMELIFYANIVWTYKDIFFPRVGSRNTVMLFLKYSLPGLY